LISFKNPALVYQRRVFYRLEFMLQVLRYISSVGIGWAIIGYVFLRWFDG
jgi:hypothetical protein